MTQVYIDEWFDEKEYLKATAMIAKPYVLEELEKLMRKISSFNSSHEKPIGFMTNGKLYISDDGVNFSFLADVKDKEIYPSDILQSPTPPEPDIPTLKKQIKHCKSHLERVALEKQLNKAYKDKKRRKNDSRT